MRVYIGWDKRDATAFEVCKSSLIRHASIPVEVVALKDWELRAQGLFWRSHWVNPRGQMFDDRDGQPFSTDFSYARFLVPALEKFGAEPVVFCDPDMLWRADVAELVKELGNHSVACVKHRHMPSDHTKITGNIQANYERKNWSSLIVIRPSACRTLTPYAVNQQPRDWLHGLKWAADDDIGALDEAWNFLEGWSDPIIVPKAVHFTRGTPDLPGYADVAFAAEWRAELDTLQRKEA